MFSIFWIILCTRTTAARKGAKKEPSWYGGNNIYVVWWNRTFQGVCWIWITLSTAVAHFSLYIWIHNEHIIYRITLHSYLFELHYKSYLQNIIFRWLFTLLTVTKSNKIISRLLHSPNFFFFYGTTEAKHNS